MHYFSISTQAGEHLGFLIMLPDDEHQQPPTGGRFAVKLQNDHPPTDQAAAGLLAQYADLEQACYWSLHSDHIELFNDAGHIGRLRNEFLSIGNQTLVLGDLTGQI